MRLADLAADLTVKYARRTDWAGGSILELPAVVDNKRTGWAKLHFHNGDEVEVREIPMEQMYDNSPDWERVEGRD